ncbi:hypothetical protein [Hymenobacter sp.]|jgi:hypothetical protein|uniref:hypothetical protein n=1 Tax=Hymenobacter sp. TaxID=1898978 RepID=UPI002ED934D2
MYIDLIASDFLTINYNYDTQILVSRWLRPVTPTEARRGYEDLLAAAQKQNAHHWLIDIRRCQSSAPETLDWLQNSYYPKLTAELRSPVCVGYFMSPDLRKDFEVNGKKLDPALIGESFRLSLCTTEGECMNWLLQEQQHPTAQLLATK